MSKKRKVLFVHDGPLYQGDDGIYRGVHYNDEIKNRYLQLGDHVTFLMRLKKVSSNEVQNFSLISPEKFEFIKVPNFKKVTSYFKINKAKNIIEKAVKEHDILVARMPSATGAIAVKFATKLKIPYVIEFVACTFDAYWNYGWKGKLIAHLKMWEQQMILKNAPYVIYVTKKFLQSRYPTKGKSINCSNVQIDKINEKDLNKRLRKIKSSEAPLILSTVASLDTIYKGQDSVLKAIGNLKKEGYFFYYKMVGQGSSDRLKKIAAEYGVENQIEFVGPLKHEKVLDFFEEIDVYIQPSKQEGLPRALIESMSKACPALGSKRAGIPELLSEENLFSPGDFIEIALKLKNINKAWMVKEAEKNWKISKEYNNDILENRRKDFFETFLNENFS